MQDKKDSEIKPSRFDNFIGFFSPKIKAQRLKAKIQSHFLEVYGRKYDGATRGRRGKGWKTRSTDQNAESDLSLHTLRDRSRDLRRNSGYARRGIEVVTSNVVGPGVKVKFKSNSKARERRINQLWNEFTESIDFEGIKNLNTMQDIAMDAIVESGEVLLRKRNVRIDSNNKFPIKIQLLESDFINDEFANAFNQVTNETTLQGIVFNDQGKRVRYNLYTEHPGSSFLRLRGTVLNTIEVDAEDIIHAYRIERPGQVRGVPWLAPVMLNLRDLEDYEDAQLIRQKIAACFTAFIIDSETGTAITEEERDDVERFEPGMIEKLSSGKTIEIASPPTVSNYNEYITTMLHKVATGLGITYSSLTGDLRQVNFSSGRMGWLEMERNVKKWQQNILIHQVLKPVVKWFFESLDLMGINSNDVSVQYITPAREMIDPTKEIPAKIKAIRAGLTTLNNAVMEQGLDPEQHFRQYKDDIDMMDENDFVFDSDPRKTSQSGLAQAETNENVDNE